MGKVPKLGFSFLHSIQICRPNLPSASVKTPLPHPLTHSKTHDISLPTLLTPPSSPHQHKYNKFHDSEPCIMYDTKSKLEHKLIMQEGSFSRTKREDKENMRHYPFSSTSNLNEQRNMMRKPKAKAVKTDDKNLSEEEKTMKQRRARTRRFKRYGSKDWTDGGIRKLEAELPEKPVSGRLGQGTVDGRMKDSFVVEKRSADPYKEFKKSMLEMIVEREILEPKGLEQLLMSFLALNSRVHHKAILKAFSEIWKEVFL